MNEFAELYTRIARDIDAGEWNKAVAFSAEIADLLSSDGWAGNLLVSGNRVFHHGNPEAAEECFPCAQLEPREWMRRMLDFVGGFVHVSEEVGAYVVRSDEDGTRLLSAAISLLAGVQPPSTPVSRDVAAVRVHVSDYARMLVARGFLRLEDCVSAVRMIAERPRERDVTHAAADSAAWARVVLLVVAQEMRFLEEEE